MNNWTETEIAFRCQRLSVRMERLAQHLSRLGSLGLEGIDRETVLATLRESKSFLELTAIDLDVNSAFELAQMQRQLSRWHIHWDETWNSDTNRREISDLCSDWANRIQAMSVVMV
jgi:hypothetical protein